MTSTSKVLLCFFLKLNRKADNSCGKSWIKSEEILENFELFAFKFTLSSKKPSLSQIFFEKILKRQKKNFSMENLEQAVNLFYKSQSNDQAQLNDFLIAHQRDPAAWTWLWSFLELQKTMEVQFFGAVTLHQKLSKNWQEVPQSMHNELKEKILQKIVEFGANGTKLVLNRLCMSVS
jgi:hypothetical protein